MARLYVPGFNGFNVASLAERRMGRGEGKVATRRVSKPDECKHLHKRVINPWDDEMHQVDYCPDCGDIRKRFTRDIPARPNHRDPEKETPPFPGGRGGDLFGGME